jgi:hypothetical protein
MFRSSLAASLALASTLAITPLAAQLAAQQQPPTQLTIYNDDFAVARTSIPLDLRAGESEVSTTDVTRQLEPDSVILRDPTGRHNFRIAEQNYDAAVVSQEWMLEKYEGQTIDFQPYANGQFFNGMNAGVSTAGLPPPVKGKIIRAGNQPLIEVDGHLQFGLPGLPLFPASTNGLLLKPTLRWQIASDRAAQFPAELDYITRGLAWQATYNVVVPETTDPSSNEKAELVGWVTLANNSGTDFPKATIQLMAGDVAKIQDLDVRQRQMAYSGVAMMAAAPMGGPIGVTQKPFDDFHLYDLHRTVSLRNGETKQLQFLDVPNVTVARSYQFEGSHALQNNNYPGYHNSSRVLGPAGDVHVDVIEEITNSEANHLGMPLPAGRLRLYRQEASGRQETSGQMQFIGESMISHTPADRTIRMVSGRSFDVTAEQRQTDFHVNEQGHFLDETFEIKLHNAKASAATVHVVEHMNRSDNWDITAKSTDFTKKDSSTIDFPVQVPAKGGATLTYAVHYTW